jgi:tetratricopeptide (TPR) repeat protein
MRRRDVSAAARVVLAAVLSASIPAHAEEGILIVFVSEFHPSGNRPVANVELVTKGGGGSNSTDDTGRVRIRLARNTKPNDDVSLEVLGDYGFIYPPGGRVKVPPFTNEEENFVTVVLMKRTDQKIWLRADQAIEENRQLKDKVDRLEKKIDVKDKIIEKLTTGTQGRVLRRGIFVLASVAVPFGTAFAPAYQTGGGQQVSAEVRANIEKAVNGYNTGYDLMRRFRFHEAIPHLETALSIAKIPEIYYALGVAEAAVPNVQRAEEVFREGLTQSEQDHNEKFTALMSYELGGILHTKPDYPAALHYATQALEIDRKLYGVNHPNVARDLILIATVLLSQGKAREALRYARDALETDEREYGKSHPTVARDAELVGQILQDRGDLKEALKFIEPDAPILAWTTHNLAALYRDRAIRQRDKKQLDTALDYSRQAIASWERYFGPNHPLVATGASLAGTILYDKGQYDEALAYAERALAIDEAAYGPDHPQVAIRENLIATILYGKGEPDAAISHIERAVRVAEKAYGPNHPRTKLYKDQMKKIQRASRKGR